jgi:NADH dehydrogenase
VRFVLIHAGDVILPEMPPSLGRSAEAVLRERGVELMLGARVRAASRGAVHLADGRSIATRTFVCTIGNAPNPIATDMLQRQSFEEARLDGRGIGVLATDETLRCKGRPGHWAVGDAAGVPSPTGKGLCPPTAQFAIRQAKTCAENIVATLEGRPLVPFRFKALGMLASLGQRKAVALMLGVRLTGFVAWFAWRTVYLMKLPGFARRLRVALDWTLDLFFHRDITQLQLAQNDRQRVHHFEDGETIITRGHIGRELFIVMNGRVDIEGERGEVIATLGPKSVFGEKAILEDTPRTATARANGPVDVLLISRPDFRALVEQLPPVREYFDRLLVERAPNAATATATETSAREASSPAMGS